jgi:hypothetical protein
MSLLDLAADKGIAEPAVRRASDVLVGLLQENLMPPYIFGNFGGGVSLSWDVMGRDIYVQIEPDGSAQLFSQDSFSVTDFEGEPVTIIDTDLAAIITQLRD